MKTGGGNKTWVWFSELRHVIASVQVVTYVHISCQKHGATSGKGLPL